MKNSLPQKNIILIFSFGLFVITAFFILFYTSYAATPDIVISQIMIGQSSSAKNEFIELFNNSPKDIDLAGYQLIKKTKSGTENTLITPAKFEGTIPTKSYFLIAFPDYASKIQADLAYSNTSYSIAPDNTILLYDQEEKLLDKVGYGEATDFEKKAAPNPPNDKSLLRKDNLDTNDNSSDFDITEANPRNSHSKEDGGDDDDDDDIPMEEDYKGKVIINEIYPAPNTKDGEEEFIEIKNLSSEIINLKGWSVSDSSHNGKALENNIFLEPEGLFVFEGSFYLNTPSDTAKLIDVNNNFVDTVSYDQAASDYSYSFDGTVWRWTKLVTKGKKNEFLKALSGIIEIDQAIYVNSYAKFKVEASKEARKFVWNFGDGHKSYLKNPRHKYSATGDYPASLKISGEGEDNTLYFTVSVINYPQQKINIIKVSPNPKGKDSKKEYLILKNQSKKKVNLKNWSLATGWKKTYNHPITKDFVIKPGKEKRLTGKYCAFTLNNQKNKIELRDPSGKTIQKIKYDRAKNKMEEDETYEEIDDKWQWNKSEIPSEDTEKDSETNQEIVEKNSFPKEEPPLNLDSFPSENSENNSSLTQNEISLENPDYQDSLVNYEVKTSSENQGSVLGISSAKTDIASFPTNTPHEKSWLTKLLNKTWFRFNAFLNLIF